MPVETPTPRDTNQLSWQPGTATLQRLRTSRLRLTLARRAVLRALHDNRGRFLDAEAVHQWTQAATWHVNLTSVYRILAELDKAPMARSNCPTCGHPNCPGQDEGIMRGLKS